jgi:hypothetical protein
MSDATGFSSMANGYLDWSSEFAGREQTDMDGIFPLTSPMGQVSASQLEEARRWWDEQGILDDRRTRVIFVGSFTSSFDFKPVREAAKAVLIGGSPCEFILCGEGSSASEIRALMAGFPNVRFLVG